MASVRRVLAYAAASLVLLELTLRVLLLVRPIAAAVIRPTQWDHAARMMWADQRLLAIVSGSPKIAWEDASPGEAWDADIGKVDAPDLEVPDAHGCRDGHLPRAPGARSVVLVGDSFTYGSDVDVTDTFGHQLEARHADLDVHNLGIPGAGPLQATLRMERDGVPIRPDAVVLVGIDADIVRTTFWFFGYAKPWPEVGPNGDLVVLGQPVPSPRELMIAGLLRPRTLDLLTILAQRIDADVRREERVAEGERRTAAVLERWAASAKAAGSVPLLIALPTPENLARRHATKRPEVDRGRRFFEAWCKGRDFPCVERWDAFDARAPDIETIREVAHWNRAGHAIVAELVEAELVTAGILAPPSLAGP